MSLMTAHQLARLLLAGPDSVVLIEDVNHALSLVSLYELDSDAIPDNHGQTTFQSVVGLEHGFTYRSPVLMGMDHEIDFSIAPLVPPDQGLPAVRIMGYSTRKSDPDMRMYASPYTESYTQQHKDKPPPTFSEGVKLPGTDLRAFFHYEGTLTYGSKKS